MLKKLLAAGVAAGLGALVLPALPAQAAVASQATLTAGTTVFPGDRSFSIAVKNNESGVLGMGTAINAVRISLPPTKVTYATAAPTGVNAGWTGTTSNVGGTEFLVYRGGTIAPGATFTFTFPGKVLRPTASDLVGAFGVQVSENNFTGSVSEAKAPAGSTLSTAIEVLEIVANSAKPVLPTNADNSKGVTDGSGTSGQTVTYQYDVKNYASTALSVTPSLTSTDTTDAPQPAAAVTIPTGEVATPLRVTVRLGDQTSGTQRTTPFTIRAVSPKADANPAVNNFVVQGPVSFGGAGLQPVRTKSGEMSARDFRLSLTKTGVQGVQLSTSTLSFAGNSASANDLPLNYAGGGSTKQVTYSFQRVNAATDGPEDVSLANAGIDDNLANYTATLNVGSITIDNLAPIITAQVTLPLDQDQDQQQASANGDRIPVSGTISSQGDLDLATLKVSLVPDAGPEQKLTNVTTSQQADGTVNYSGSIASTLWDANATRFQALATVSDTALNVGSVSTLPFPVDTTLAVLVDPGVVLTTTTIEATFFDLNGIRGGCDESAYMVNGVPLSVIDVRNGSGGACDPKALDFSGKRILVLRNALAPTETPEVAYSVGNRSLGAIPAKDGAGNDALAKVIDTVNNVVPLAPLLTTVERKDGSTFETAYRDAAEDAYYTNATGAEDNRVTVSGARAGYILQVRDGNGAVLKETSPLINPNTGLNPPATFNATITVPTGTVNTDYFRTLHFVSNQGVASVGTPLTLVVDTVDPRLAATQVTEPGKATSTFNEKIVAGGDIPENWYIGYLDQIEEGTVIRYKTVLSVATTDATTRSITFQLDDASSYRSTEYNVQSGARYEDRAGNFLANTI